MNANAVEMKCHNFVWCVTIVTVIVNGILY